MIYGFRLWMVSLFKGRPAAGVLKVPATKCLSTAEKKFLSQKKYLVVMEVKALDFTEDYR